MKKKKVLIYLLSALIPCIIFFICATINKYVPFGSEMLNSYDSFTQYPGMLLEYANLLRSGNIFYSWNAGLGFNFFGSLTYYGMSPLNLFSLLANPSNYHIFIAIMTFLRFALLGSSMCFYLSHKNIKPLYIVLFSTIYALMGYTSTYYYNYIWIDSIIMLPLVIHGLNKLIDESKPLFYIVALTFTILINYYIGFMICVFSLVWFLYRLVGVKNKKSTIKTFAISSLFAGLMSAVVLLPSFFALLTGKAELYGSTDYLGITNNFSTFFYTLTTGTYTQGDQINGPALVYSTIMVAVLTIFFFFNKKFTKKEKIAALMVILFFYLSFTFNLLNYAWQFFQKPIWWQSRFSFTFSFFLITLAVKTLTNIEESDFKTKYRIISFIVATILILIGAFVKWNDNNNTQIYTYFYLGLSLLILIEMIFLLDKKGFLTMLIIFTGVEVSINTYNSLKNNFRYKSYTDYQYKKDEIPSVIEKLNAENDNFYRFELMDDYMSNDGLYFNFHGLNYFNSARNIDVIHMMASLGVKVYDDCHIELLDFDPIILSLFNIKYLYGDDIDYFINIDRRVHENPYPLALGFLASDKIKSLKLDDEDYYANKEKLVQTLSGLDDKLYTRITHDNFKQTEDDTYSYYTYTFTSDGHYLVMPVDFSGKIRINEIEQSFKTYYLEIEEGDEVTIEYSIASKHEIEEVFMTLLDLDAYEAHMNKLSETTMVSSTHKDGHILVSNIEVSEDNSYLFTTIEYESGMKIYVDGKEIKPDILLGALIGLELDEGTHEIVIDYIPKGLIPGSIISIAGLIGTILYLQKRKKAL